jgi:glycosyltransferase involved in cell wall biosynthesis
MVNYNGAPYLEASLGSVFAQRAQFTEILLIDNASEDNRLEIVRRHFAGVRIVPLTCNRGPAAARNVGFQAATADRILFIDNDVSLAVRCADRLTRALMSTRALPSPWHACCMLISKTLSNMMVPIAIFWA